MKYTATEALATLRPGAKWVVREINNESIVEWLDEEIDRPTDQEISDTIQQLQNEYDSREYQRRRVAEYPSFGEQFDLLYHEGYDAWRALITSIKDKYPKV